MLRLVVTSLFVLFATVGCSVTDSIDSLFSSPEPEWGQFRGPSSAGVSDASSLPVTWSETENVEWTIPLLGFGASSPIVVGDRVYVSSYSGYGLDADEPGDQQALVLHLSCYRVQDGELVWRRDVEPEIPDQDYERWLPEHGYASATPASDGIAIYAFFGKSGLHAYLLDGEPLWSVNAGDGTHGFGTAGSPLLYRDLVIVNAGVESGDVIAFDKQTGDERWRAAGVDDSWATPVLVTSPEERDEVVLSMKGAVVAYDPLTGDELWRAEGVDDYVCPSVVENDGIVYALGGRKSIKALAVRTGGSGDVTETHRDWTSKDGSKVPSPVYHDGHLYWIGHDGFAYCLNAADGTVAYKARIEGLKKKKTYASPLLANGKLYIPTCFGGTVVLAAKPEFELLAINDLGDESVFNASPIVAGERMFLRSDRFLYCLRQSP